MLLVINLLNGLINFEPFDKFVNGSLILINGGNKMTRREEVNNCIDKSIELLDNELNYYGNCEISKERIIALEKQLKETIDNLCNFHI